MVVWKGIVNYNKGHIYDLSIFDVDINRSSKTANTATFKCYNFIDILDSDGYEAMVSIKCDGIVVFEIGRIIKVVDTGRNIYEISCEELSGYLYHIHLKQENYLNAVIHSLNSSNEKKTIQQIVNDITSMANRDIRYNGVIISISPIISSDIANLTTIPYIQGNLPIPKMEFGTISVGKALNKFVVETLGLTMRYGIQAYGYFTKTSNTPVEGFTNKYEGGTFSSVVITVYIGYYDSLVVYNVEESFTESTVISSNEGNRSKVECVLVRSSDGKKYGLAKKDGLVGVDGKTAFYQLDGNYTEEELCSFASSILEDRNKDMKSYKLKFPAGKGILGGTTITNLSNGDTSTTKPVYRENVIFCGLGDQSYGEGNSRNMVWKGLGNGDGSNLTVSSALEVRGKDLWKIQNMRINSSYTEIVVGTNILSVFDMYKGRLNEIDGTSVPRELKEETTEWMNTASGSSDYTTVWSVNILNTNVDDITLTAQRSSQDSYIGDRSSYNRTIDLHPNSIAAGGSYSYSVPINSAPSKYEHGNISLSWDITAPSTPSGESTHDFDVTISVQWFTNAGEEIAVIKSSSPTSTRNGMLDGTPIHQQLTIESMNGQYDNGGIVTAGYLKITSTNNSPHEVVIRTLHVDMDLKYSLGVYSG